MLLISKYRSQPKMNKQTVQVDVIETTIYNEKPELKKFPQKERCARIHSTRIFLFIQSSLWMFSICSVRIVIEVITGCSSASIVPLSSTGSADSQTASTTSNPSVTYPKTAY